MKEYLGDGVFVEVKHGTLMLTTEDGVSVKNKIWLEQEVLEKLLGYIAKAAVRTKERDNRQLNEQIASQEKTR